MHIVVVCGTNREGALSRLLATETGQAYEQLGHTVDLLDMAELPAEALLPTAYKERADNVTALVEPNVFPARTRRSGCAQVVRPCGSRSRNPASRSCLEFVTDKGPSMANQ